MIYNIKGILTYAEPTFAVVECGGVGFKCFISMTTLQQLPSPHKEVNLYTYLAIREDAMDLYGFYEEDELEAFKLLITVSGVGPKAAMAILSALPPERLSIAVSGGDVRAIQQANGVGKKTAERVVLELKDKMGGIGGAAAAAVSEGLQAATSGKASEAVEVLVSLGFERSDAALAVSQCDPSLSVDQMINAALKQFDRF